MKIAVVGAGIAGLSCAWRLSQTGSARVTLFEAGSWLGGHAHTVDVAIDGFEHPVDTGFLVFNRRTYPRLVALFDEIGIDAAPSEMTFSARIEQPDGGALEWAGTSLDSLFAQRRNLASPRFVGMLAQLLRFNREASALARDIASIPPGRTLGDFLDEQRYATPLRDWYLLPMAAAIWSCSTRRMLDFPLATFVRFCANHGLLAISHRPQWFTVARGSRRYVDRLRASIDDVRAATPVTGVVRRHGASRRVAVRTRAGTEVFDQVVLACHSDQALALLDDPGAHEEALLGAIRYQSNRAVLHVDADVLPRRRRAWAAWNYHAKGVASSDVDDRRVAVHYLVNKLQPVPFTRPVIVSLNPVDEPRAECVLGEWEYAHPVFDAPAIAAQARLPELQGRDGTWYCGAWTGYGFHEDGLASGLDVAAAIAEAAGAPGRTTTGTRLAA